MPPRLLMLSAFARVPALPDKGLSFDELDKSAKEKALTKFRDWQCCDQWWEYTYEDFIEVAKCLGITIDYDASQKQWAIHFSGFSSQGDGACFKGEYSPKSDAVEAVKEHAPQYTELHRIAAELTALQVTAKLKLGGTVCATIRTDSSSYCHSGTMTVDCSLFEETPAAPFDWSHFNLLALRFRKAFCDLADWLYKQLEEEYEYQTSDEVVTEVAREHRFTEDGAII